MCFDDDFFDDFELEDAMLIGSIGTYFEEELEEKKIIEQEQEVEEEKEEDDYEDLIP